MFFSHQMVLFKSRSRLILSLRRTFSSQKPREKYCAIIGSGPAGFYTAQGIFKDDNTHVHIFERLPVPFGLVRYGVAPDHPEVKNVINRFTQTAAHKNFRFFGNVEMGKDLTVSELRKAYDAVIMCYGADSEKKLNIPGEDSEGVHSAQSFVGWYDGLPRFAHLKPDLSSSTAVVIGQGNVAVDVARILLSSPAVLAKTDITSEALSTLVDSKVTTVHLVGRRGPLQAAFTTKELRELLNMEDVSVHMNRKHFEVLAQRLTEIRRPKRRLVDLMLKHVGNHCNEPPSVNKKHLYIDFFKMPVALTSQEKSSKVTGVRFLKTGLVDPTELSPQSQVKPLPGQEVTMESGLVIKSIGYRGVAIDPSLPFDNATGTIANNQGRVKGMPGVYCSGWICGGAVGVIADTMINAFHVARNITQDLADVVPPNEVYERKAAVRATLIERLEEKCKARQLCPNRD